MNWKTLFKTRWKLILTTLLIMFMAVSLLILSIKFSIQGKQLEKVQTELVEKDYEIDIAKDEARAKEVNKELDNVTVKVKKKKKIVDEIKKDINNPIIDFYDPRVQDSIESKFNKRFNNN